MKKISSILTVAAAFGCMNLINATAFAQGGLTPPSGAPAPVMKSLDQVEARIPLIPGSPGVTITNGYYTITKSGSYYLTGDIATTNNVANLITFATNHITLDLNGFTLFGTTGSIGSAIYGRGYGYHVLNGHIVGGTTQTNGVFTPVGFNSGISIFIAYADSSMQNIVSGVTVRGVRYRGIEVSMESVVERCIVNTVQDHGIIAGTVRDSQAINTGGHAIQAKSVLNCVGRSVGTTVGRNGICGYNDYPCQVENSIGETITGYGINAHNAMNSQGRSESGYGLYARTALNCTGESITGQAGLLALVANTCVGTRYNGTAIKTTIGIGCMASGGTNNITHKYNMP